MKSAVRWILSLVISTTLLTAGIAAVMAQPSPPIPDVSGPAERLPDPRLDSVFANATKLEADQAADKAFEEYTRIKNENASQKPAVAADALLRATLLGYNGLATPHSQEFEKLSPELKEIRSSKETDLAKKSHEALKQIKDDPKLAETQVGKYVLEQHWKNVETGAPADLKTSLESQIDHRNSAQISYQLVDKLVHLTGARPEFSYWFALIIIALVVKTLTFPLTLRTYKSQREMQRVQPMMKALQDKYKGKPELNEKMMEFYKEHKVNPFASCVPMLVQLPFMYYVYNTIRLYEYHFSHGTFLWIGSKLSFQYPSYLATDLAKFDIPLLTIYAISNYLTMKLNPTPDPAQAQQQKSMSVFMTITFFYFFMKYQWSAAFIFYWLILNFITAFQQYNYIFKPNRLKAQATGGVVMAPEVSSSRSSEDRQIRGNQPAPVSAAAASRPRPKARKRK